MNYSPLRYPGGKGKIAPLVEQIVQNCMPRKQLYIEPFAGGAGVALRLLFNGVVTKIILNDYDKAIYSFWRAVKESPEEIIELIKNTPITIEEWRRQKEIYLTKNHRYSVALGFAAFFLNRTNRSGILNAGPIGGYEQNGRYTIQARFNRGELVHRIERIVAHKDKIIIYNKEIRSFIQNIVPKYQQQAFIYFDPPYYINGQRLYKNALSDADHKEIAKYIGQINCPWIITYDFVPRIKVFYKDFPQACYSLNYSAANKGKGKELVVFQSDQLRQALNNLQGDYELL